MQDLILDLMSSFDLDALHEGCQSWSGLDKHLVVVATLVWPLRNALKAIEVQLSLETAEASHAKVLGHNLVREVLGIVDMKGESTGNERGNIGLIGLLEIFQHLVKLAWKGTRVFAVLVCARAAVSGGGGGGGDAAVG